MAAPFRRAHVVEIIKMNTPHQIQQLGTSVPSHVSHLWMVNGLRLQSAFQAPSQNPKVLYEGLSFTYSHRNLHTKGQLALLSPAGDNLGFVLPKDTTTDWNGAGFEPPIPWLLDHLLHLLSHVNHCYWPTFWRLIWYWTPGIDYLSQFEPRFHPLVGPLWSPRWWHSQVRRRSVNWPEMQRVYYPFGSQQVLLLPLTTVHSDTHNVRHLSKHSAHAEVKQISRRR